MKLKHLFLFMMGTALCTTPIFCGKKGGNGIGGGGDDADSGGGGGSGGECTQTTLDMPPKRDGMLAVTIHNETNCRFSDDQINIQFLATPDNSGLVEVISSITSKTEDGYPIAIVKAPSSYPIVVPSITLEQLNHGSFYLKSDDNSVLANARFFISLGKTPLESLKIQSATYYDQPNEVDTPFDIFEFGFDPNKQKAYGFNTSQVASFSVPFWFHIYPANPIPSNPSTDALGIKLRDTTISPINLLSQKDVITKYDDFTKFGPSLFKLDNLKQGNVPAQDGSTEMQISHILAPPTVPLSGDMSHYFDSNFTDFFKYYSASKPFRMCTGDPGPNSTVSFPGCAANSCPNAGLPGCNNNACPNPSPTGYRDTGDCFIGYTTDGGQTFSFWHYVNDTTLASDDCNGSVRYNGSTKPIYMAPTNLCTIKIPSFSGGNATKCALDNNCFVPGGQSTNVGIFNTYIMAAIMRNDATNYDVATGYTEWTDPSKFYLIEPYNWYAKFWHTISIGHYAYGFGYDDAGGQSTTYTPDANTLTNVVIGIGW